MRQLMWLGRARLARGAVRPSLREFVVVWARFTRAPTTETFHVKSIYISGNSAGNPSASFVHQEGGAPRGPPAAERKAVEGSMDMKDGSMGGAQWLRSAPRGRRSSSAAQSSSGDDAVAGAASRGQAPRRRGGIVGSRALESECGVCTAECGGLRLPRVRWACGARACALVALLCVAAPAWALSCSEPGHGDGG